MSNTAAGLDFHAETNSSATLVKDYVALLSLNTLMKADHFTGVQKYGIIHDLRRVPIAQWRARHTYLAELTGLNHITCISVKTG